MKIEKTLKQTTQTIFKAKENFHKKRARLPIEEKIKILVELQKIGINANKKFKNRKVWKI